MGSRSSFWWGKASSVELIKNAKNSSSVKSKKFLHRCRTRQLDIIKSKDSNPSDLLEDQMPCLQTFYNLKSVSTFSRLVRNEIKIIIRLDQNDLPANYLHSHDLLSHNDSSSDKRSSRTRLNQIMSFCCCTRKPYGIVIITYATTTVLCVLFVSRFSLFSGLGAEFSATATATTTASSHDTPCECYVVIKEWENMSRLIPLHASIKAREGLKHKRARKKNCSVTAHELASPARRKWRAENDKNLFREIWLLWPSAPRTYYMAYIGNLWFARTHKLRQPRAQAQRTHLQRSS